MTGKRKKPKTKNYHENVKAFARNPAGALANIKEDASHVLNHNGKTYKVVLSSQVPEGATSRTTLDASPISQGHKRGDRSAKTFTPENIVSMLGQVQKNNVVRVKLNDTRYAIVAENMALITPTTNPDTKPAGDPTPPNSAGAPLTAKAAEANVDNDATPDISQMVVSNAAIHKFDTYNWSEFIHHKTAEERDVGAYGFVTENNGVAVVKYANRGKPIGFMMPRSVIKEDCVSTTARFPLSHFAKTIKGKWASAPYHPDIVTVAHQDKPPMLYVTMGAALELRKKGLFDNAPQFVHDHLNVAMAEKAKLDMAKAGFDDKKATPPPKKPKTAAPVKDASLKTTHADAARSDANIITHANGVEWSNTALATLSNAIKKAKTTERLVEIRMSEDDILYVTNNAEVIDSMAGVVSIAETMGCVEAPKMETMDFNPDRIDTMMSALKGCWRMTHEGNSVVVLKSTDGSQLAMTKRQDLVNAIT